MSADLEKQILELSRIADHNSDVDAVLKVFHNYLHYFAQNHVTGVLEQFSGEQEDISLEVGEEGRIVGRADLEKHFAYMPRLAQKPGVLVYHYVTTEVVEIAQDGQTAKLTALSPSCDAMGQAQIQNWIYGKYHVDLVKQSDGQWKLWHVQWFRTFEAAVTLGWLKEQTAHDAEVVHPKLADVYADPAPRAGSSYPPAWPYPRHYDPERVNYLMPEPPEPYAHWDGSTAMKMTRGY